MAALSLKKILLVLTAFVLMLTPLYADAVHHAIHADSNQADHRDNDPNCAVCHYANSSIASLTTAVVLIVPHEYSETVFASSFAQPNLSELYSLAQPRSPPANS